MRVDADGVLRVRIGRKLSTPLGSPPLFSSLHKRCADAGTSVSFSGSASDPEDGNLSGGLSWSSSLDGSIGSGASFSTSGLSVGSHTITASVTDSGGLSDSAQVSITVTVPTNNPPSVST